MNVFEVSGELYCISNQHKKCGNLHMYDIFCISHNTPNAPEYTLILIGEFEPIHSINIQPQIANVG